MPLVSVFPTKYEGYYVTRSGEVWSLRQPSKGLCKLHPYPNTNGYLRVKIHCPELRKIVMVHHLVLDTFHGPKPTLKHEARHLNGDKIDNRTENLAWGTTSENALDRVRHGTNVLPPEESRAKGIATKIAKGSIFKPYCPAGHPMSGDNIYMQSRGFRECRACKNKRNRDRQRRYSAARAPSVKEESQSLNPKNERKET